MHARASFPLFLDRKHTLDNANAWTILFSSLGRKRRTCVLRKNERKSPFSGWPWGFFENGLSTRRKRKDAHGGCPCCSLLLMLSLAELADVLGEKKKREEERLGVSKI